MFLPRYRSGSWLALSALAIQLVISFGHVHLDGVHAVYPPVKVAGVKTHAQPTPAQQPGDDDYCPICATIYLAGNSFVPQPPALPPQLASRSIEHFHRAPSAIIVAARRQPFQPRAPPQA